MPTGNDVRKQLQCSKQHLIHLHYLPPTHTQFYSIQFINVVLIHSSRQPPVNNHLVIAGKKSPFQQEETCGGARLREGPSSLRLVCGTWGKNRKEDHREKTETRGVLPGQARQAVLYLSNLNLDINEEIPK